MTSSSIGRYINLMRFIRNWPLYFRMKQSSGFMPARFTTRSRNLSFDVPTFELYLVFKEIFMSDFYSIDQWVHQLPDSPVVVDVGGNAGYFSMLLLSKKPDSRIYGYEPIASNFQLYRNNLQMNPSLTGAQVFHFAVTGAPVDTITLYKESTGNNSVTASVFRDFESHNLVEEKVNAISLEQILSRNNLEKVDFLKLDCEGSEYPILYDSPPAIWSKINTIFLEVHNLDEEKRNFKSVDQFLSGEGYRTTHRLASNGCFAVYATRN